MSNTYFRGQGKIYIAARDSNGLSTGFTPIGDAEVLNIGASEQFDSVYENETGARVKVVHSATQLDVNFSMTVLNFSAANLAKSFLGTASAVTGATVADEAHKAFKGSSIFLKFPGVSAVTVTNVAGSTTYVVSTDYTVDASSGRIDFPAGSSIVEGAEVRVDYTHGGVDGSMEAFVNTDNREYTIIFEGKNMNQQGTPVIVTLHRAYMNVASQLALLGTATQKFELSGALLPDNQISAVGVSQFFNLKAKSLN